jgi:predicted nucleotidyltransferase
MDKREATAIAKQYAQVVAQDMNPDKIVLYGSTANGTRRDDSDIDVAVIYDKFEGDWLETAAQLCELSGKIRFDDINVEIEPLLCSASEDISGFVQEILRTGEVLFERSQPL